MFADEVGAHRYLERLLWPNGLCCPRCRSTAKVGKLNGASTRAAAYKCYSCRKAFSLLHGTLMSSSHVPAHKWLQAIYLTEGGAGPMRPHHLSRILNVSFKTAASMMRRIGKAADNLRPTLTTGVPSATHRRSAPMELPGLLVDGLPKPLRVKIDFDAGTVDQMIERLLVLRAQILPAPPPPTKRN